MLARRQLPLLVPAFKPLRAAARDEALPTTPRVLQVSPIGAAGALLAPLAARVAALSGGAVELREGSGGALLGALVEDAAPHPALLPFAGFPFGMTAAELRHWLGTADGAALWTAGFAAEGAQAWPVCVVTRQAIGAAPVHGAVIELRLGAPVDPALVRLFAAACDAKLAAPPWPPASRSFGTPGEAANWLRSRFETPPARALRVAERFVCARISACFAGNFRPG